MTDHRSKVTTVDPFVIVERPEDPRTDPLRLEYTVHPAPDSEGGVDLPHARWVADLADRHVNPRWDERFEVVDGALRVGIDGTETTLTEGEDVVIPATVPHRHWNPTPEPARVRYEARPGLRAAEALETLYTLAQAGRTDEEGVPNPLQFAVIQDAYPGYFYSTDQPRILQRAMVATLAPIGRLLGYEATYTRDEMGPLRRSSTR
ncbi:cupin [Halobiforma lacisalsi AJ5]|uniref:Cupin n=1 Tax=Natronobacterium lacisalsi AJ5 TaxID=358396 RepID=M0L5L9_NATLA|nr:cupin domain-containing protein [Halobiforma lacisalsi]APW98921.1 cupin [Halobiforma lacisalsi AJ5]EMA27285.1 cupin [Halobiforma lacisalsi AJ5]